jgi:hypothetical protein
MRTVTPPTSEIPTAQVTIRPSTAADAGEIARLATIDSAAVPAGPMLLAEVEGQLRAGLELAGGVVIADPFVATTGLIELLRVRSQTSGGHRRRRARAAVFALGRFQVTTR